MLLAAVSSEISFVLLLPLVLVKNWCDQSQLTTKVPKHLPGPAWEKYSAQAVHALMYPLMFSIPATGVLMGYFGGSGIPFFGLRIPGKEKTTDADMQVCTMQFGVRVYTLRPHAGPFVTLTVPLTVPLTI